MSAKRGHKSTELCRVLDIQPYVLRYWETEFKALQAAAGTPSAQRTYSDADLALVRRIKQLLYEEGYTIAGAKKKLESEPIEALAAAECASLFGETGEAAPPPSEGPAPAKRSSGAAASSDGETPTSPPLDTASGERIKQLRRGIDKALGEAQSILKILDKHPH